MKTLTACVLFARVCAGLLFVHSSKACSASLSDADTLRQLNLDWEDATKAIDINRISQIIADDWRGVFSSGKIRTKDIVLNYVQTREIKLQSYEFGPMDISVLGNARGRG